MIDLFKELKDRAIANKQRIVLPESTEIRTLQAANQVLAEDIAEVILIGKPEEIQAKANELNLTHINKATIIDNTNDAWGEHVEMLSKESEYFKKCSEQVDSKINAILDEIEGVLAGESTLEKFDTILRSMLKTLKIALMPTFLDSVFVGDISSKFTGNGDLYVLGANSGALPTESEGGAIITAKDEELFKE